MDIKKKKSLPPSSLIVTQSNQLVEARYNLPLAEQRIILTMIARIQPDDEDFKPYRISIKDLSEFMGIDRNSAYRECKKLTKSLLTRIIEIAEPGRLLQIGWVSSAEYIEGSGMVNLCFDPLLKPYLLSLKGNFTSVKLEMILSFKSQYTMRVYSLLKQYEGFRDQREIQVDTLRELLGLSKGLHKEYSNFKANILKPVQKELLEKADLYFDLHEIKNGRRIVALKFAIYSRDIPNNQSSKIPLNTPRDRQLIRDTSSSLDELISLIPDIHRSKKTVFTALETYEKKHGFNYVKRNILYSNEKAEKSYAGFLCNSLRSDWGHDWMIELEQKKLKKSVQVWERHGFASEKEYNDFMYKKHIESLIKNKSST